MSASRRILSGLTVAAVLAAVFAAAAFVAAVQPTIARASTTQQSMMEDDGALRTNLDGTIATMHQLGVSIVKVGVYWSMVAPAPNSFKVPRNFNAADPAAYPQQNWAFYDDVVERAKQFGMKVAFMLTGPAPLWATGSAMPKTSNCPCGQWKPSPAAFMSFVRAVGERYDGSYTPKGSKTPLPRVSFWTIWNEPNYGPRLAPQAIDHDTIEVGAVAYRSLLNAAWRGLKMTGHTLPRDTILIGETAPRGLDHPIGNFSGVKPLRFLRALYCVGTNYRPLTGAAAAARSCPKTAAASRAFRAQNPALFNASGFADHPYAVGDPPDLPTYGCGAKACANVKTHESDPDYADFPEIPRLERTLDRLNAAYGSSTKFQIWNTEYGWWTRPPDVSKAAISPTLAAYYMNWAEYISYTQKRISSYDQYLLIDPGVVYATGLELASGRRLATFDAFELPLYLPVTSSSGGAKSLLIWGAVRPAPYALSDTGMSQQAMIQFQPGSHGAFKTLQIVTIANPLGYFEVHQPFTRSGAVRLAWQQAYGAPVYSRTVAITIK
jgi:hypothetical protein